MTNCSLIRIAVLLLFGTLGVRGIAAADELYVATDGKDTNSGTKAAPFATLERARDEIRRMKPKDGATVFVREGTYYLPNTFRLGPKDSGTAEAPVVYRSFENETVTLSGGRCITGFGPPKGEVQRQIVCASWYGVA